MDTYAIETSNVSRSFAESLVVDNLNLRVPRGSIYGFLGRNGAGKTTTIKMLAGLIWPDGGKIKVNGADPARFTVEDRWKIGYVSERQILNPFMRVGKLIGFTSNFYPDWDSALCERMLQQFQIDPAKRIRALSMGQARQVAFILAMAQRRTSLFLTSRRPTWTSWRAGNSWTKSSVCFVRTAKPSFFPRTFSATWNGSPTRLASSRRAN